MTLAGKLRICELYAGTARSIEPFRAWDRVEVALLADMNANAARTYVANHEGAPYKPVDLGAAKPGDLFGLAGGDIDVLLGCPPCQGFSENGLRRADDERNAHVLKFGDFALASRPRAIVMENVPMAAASDEFRLMCENLERGNYRWTAMIANAAQYGSAQSRQRLLFVAVDRNRGDAPVFAAPTHGSGNLFSYSTRADRPVVDDVTSQLGLTPSTQRLASSLPQNFSKVLGPAAPRTVGEQLAGLPDTDTEEARKLNHVPRGHTPAVLARMSKVPEGGRPDTAGRFYSQTYGRLHRRGLARTITTFFWHAGAGRFWHPTEPRTITMREAARLQGFDDEFLFNDESRSACTLVGNALDAALATLCYRTVRAALA